MTRQRINRPKFRTRDEQVADLVRQQQELGGLDVELSAYGIAYLDIDGEMKYRISSQEKDIYQFMYHMLPRHIFCSNVLSLQERTSVPAGTREDKELALKIKLGKQLKDTFPKSLFSILAETATDYQSNDSYIYFIAQQEKLENSFDATALDIFDILLQDAYSRLYLAQEHYLALTNWLKTERKFMGENFLKKDVLGKTFYGFISITDHTQRIVQDTLPTFIYRKYFSEMTKPVYTSGIYQKTYWYNHRTKIIDLQKSFKREMNTAMSQRLETYQAYLPLKEQPPENNAVRQLPEACQQTYARYVNFWQARK